MNTCAKPESPFHAGEQALQAQAGKRDAMETQGRRVIRDFMPDQHRQFYAQLPFIVVGSVDGGGNPWASLLTGQPGFAQSPDARTLNIAFDARGGDPALEYLTVDRPVGLLGIELSTRRRNRMNGHVIDVHAHGISVRVDQAFGNCPQYIHARAVDWLDGDFSTPQVERFTELPAEAVAAITRADTFFVASAVPLGRNLSAEGVDVSHRGGRPGFVKVEGNRLTVPDFSGNNHFNTLGNFLVNPRAGLTFVDFESGDLLQVTGTVELLEAEDPDVAAFRGAERAWRVELAEGQWLRGALPLRFESQETSANNSVTDTWPEAAERSAREDQRKSWQAHTVVRVVQETARIRSLYLQPANGGAIFEHDAGQHLPIRVGADVRTYTLSSAPGDSAYRISVKREDDGKISHRLHALEVGDVIEARGPRGHFVLDTDNSRPVLLIGAGVGITPMISMAQHLANEAVRRRSARPVWVFHAARDEHELAFSEQFDNLSAKFGLRYERFVSGSGAGRLSVDALRSRLPLDDYEAYLCGPGGFMQSLYAALRQLGVADQRIHAESFGPSGLQRDASAEVVESAESAGVVFAASQSETLWSAADGTLLEFAEQHGVEPEFGCRAGSCGTCAMRVTAGSAVNLQTGSVSTEGDEVLVCCSVPAAGSERLVLE